MIACMAHRKIENLLDNFEQIDGRTSMTLAKRTHKRASIIGNKKRQEVVENDDRLHRVVIQHKEKSPTCKVRENGWRNKQNKDKEESNEQVLLKKRKEAVEGHHHLCP